jgi:CBS domain-containing protein
MNGNVTVRELMDRDFVGVSESDRVRETVELMLEEDADSVIVLRGNDPVGVLTERDVLEQLVAGGVANATVGDAMTEEVETMRADRTVAEAADVMSTQATKRVLVTDGEAPRGILTEHDLLNTAPFGPDGTRAASPEEGPVAVATIGERMERAAASASEGALEDQSICEACGSLTRNLSTFNGQLLCSDCRDL